MVDEIPLFEIPWDENDVANVVESVSRGGFWAKGPFVDEFENRLEEFLGVEHAKVVNSGTTALVSLLRGMGIGKGDEVIVPSLTFVATANAVRLVGADPVFADIERDTYGLDPASVEAVVSEDTGAIMPVHVYGQSFKADGLRDVADDHDVPLLEDAAAALGATYGDEMAGTLGRGAAISFCQNKIVPTGEGGAVVTDDDELARNVELYRSHGRSSSEYFDSPSSGDYVRVGTNYRMPDVVAALGCSQMEKIGELIEGRRAAAHRMTNGIQEIPGVEPPQEVTGEQVYQLYTITLKSTIDRDAVISKLNERGIASKIYWEPIHDNPQFEDAIIPEEGLPVTRDIASRVLSLPIHPDISRQETDRIIRGVSDIVTAQ